MTRPLGRIALVVIVCACVSLTPAHAAEQAEAPVNAALRYWPQFMQLSDALSVDPTIDPAIAFTGDASQEARRSEQFVEQHADIVSGLIRASSHAYCDWGIDTGDGIETQLLHLAHARRSVNLVLADARRLRAGGDEALIAERLAASLRLARHTNDAESFLISALVSVAIFSRAHDQIVADLDAGRLGEDARRTLAKALAEFPDDDAFGMRRSIAAEGALLGAWLRREFSAGEGFDWNCLLLDDEPADKNRALKTIRAMQGKEGAAEWLVRPLEQAYADIVAAWGRDDAEEELRRLSDKAEAGGYGPLAEMLLPAFDRAWTNNALAAAKLRALKERLNP